MYGNISEIPTSCLAICFQVDSALRCLSCWMTDWDGISPGNASLTQLDLLVPFCWSWWWGVWSVLLNECLPGRQRRDDVKTWDTCWYEVTRVILVYLLKKKANGRRVLFHCHTLTTALHVLDAICWIVVAEQSQLKRACTSISVFKRKWTSVPLKQVQDCMSDSYIHADVVREARSCRRKKGNSFYFPGKSLSIRRFKRSIVDFCFVEKSKYRLFLTDFCSSAVLLQGHLRDAAEGGNRQRIKGGRFLVIVRHAWIGSQKETVESWGWEKSHLSPVSLHFLMGSSIGCWMWNYYVLFAAIVNMQISIYSCL